MMKLPIQFQRQFAGKKPLDEETGQILAEWAKGGSAGPVDDIPTLKANGAEMAKQGTAALQTWFSGLTLDQKKQLKPTLDAEWKQTASQAVV